MPRPKHRRSLITADNHFETGVGGRRPLGEALSLAPEEKFEKLSALLAQPARAHDSLGHLCKLAGVTLADLHEFWKQHQYHIAMIRAYNRVPKIVDDTFRNAEARMDCCTRCDGLGTVTDSTIDKNGELGRSRPRTCPVCHGSKEIEIIGDKAARDLVFESIGLTGRKSPTVAIQQNFGLDAELGDVLSLTQKVITGGGSE